MTNQDTRLRDWANLRAIAMRTKRCTRADAVFMGDSITDFWQQPRFGGFFPGKNYVDRGISAQTTPQMLIRFRPDVVALKPRVVVILAGTNDIAGNTGPMTNEEIQNNLASMAELATSEQHQGRARQHHAGERLPRGAERQRRRRHAARSSGSRRSTTG